MSDIVQASADLSSLLRAWLRSRREPFIVQAGALAYELTALVAHEARTVPQAYDLLDDWVREMKNQIRELGVGVEHP